MRRKDVRLILNRVNVSMALDHIKGIEPDGEIIDAEELTQARLTLAKWQTALLGVERNVLTPLRAR